MALPTILVDSATGSDTQASGAGPGTALFGTTDASTDGAGTTVTVTAGTDLSGVATDGSAVIFLNDTTAGNRNFGKITGSAGSGGATPTVTVANAFGASLTTKSWAIGGKRASIGATTSRKLFDNNTAAGDAMPGWTIQLASGHSESLSSALSLRRAGDTTSGPITLKGVDGFATRPLLTWTSDADALVVRAASIVLTQFEQRNSGGHTASRGIVTTANGPITISNIKMAHATNYWWKGVVVGASGCTCRDCDIGPTGSHGIEINAGSANCGDVSILWNYIHSPGDIGINFVNNPFFPTTCFGNIVYNATGHGIVYDNTRGDLLGGGQFAQNTVDTTASGKDGLRIVTDAANLSGLQVWNNTFSNCGGYGLNFSFSPALVKIQGYGCLITNNNYYNNTSGTTNPSGVDPNAQTVNPPFSNAAGGNFALTTTALQLGWPTVNVGTTSSTPDYVDIGAAQRQESGGTNVFVMMD